MASVIGYGRSITTFDFTDGFGTPLDIEAADPSAIVIVTNRGYRVSFEGQFDYRSNKTLAASPVDTIEVETLDGEPVMRVADFRLGLKTLFDRQFKAILAGDDTIRGGEGGSGLYGWAGNDVLIGGPSGDKLDGGAGIDLMRGGLGDDFYYVDRTEDTIEDPDGGRVFSSAPSYTLPEPLTMLAIAPGAKSGTLIGNDLDNNLYGRGGRDRIEGRGGNDYIEGGGGADTLAGGPGDDLYIVSNKRVQIVERAGEGIDTVRSSVDFALADDVEHLRLEGPARKGIGNDLANELFGSGLTTLLDARGGDDLVRVSISGADVAVTIVGGSGADRARWEGLRPDTAPDRFVDFAPGDGDVVDLGGVLPGDATADPFAHVRLTAAKGGAMLETDVDGPAGPSGWAPLVFLPGIAPGEASLTALLALGAIDLG